MGMKAKICIIEGTLGVIAIPVFTWIMTEGWIAFAVVLMLGLSSGASFILLQWGIKQLLATRRIKNG